MMVMKSVGKKGGKRVLEEDDSQQPPARRSARVDQAKAAATRTAGASAATTLNREGDSAPPHAIFGAGRREPHTRYGVASSDNIFSTRDPRAPRERPGGIAGPSCK